MTTTRKVNTARAIVDDVLGRGMTREMWTANYDKALPISVQNFDLTAVLPAVFFMFRFGRRRGQGKFMEAFGPTTGTPRERRRSATIDHIAAELAKTDRFKGFRDETGQAILGDLLLSFCLENSGRALGRQEQVQRVAPAHYMSSWVDLPETVAHLRFVPEMIVAMLANQKGRSVEQTKEDDRTWFAVGKGFEDNVLLKAFYQGVVREGFLAGRTADRFNEKTPVGLDQLLMIRLALQLGSAPGKLRGSEGELISNQRPISELASENFAEDIRKFVRTYAEVVPRHAFVDLLESSMAVGLTTIVTSAIEILFEWAKTGQIPKKHEQTPTHLFVDCSNGTDPELRALAEQTMDDFMRRIESFPMILMSLRLLDYTARYDPNLKKLDIETRPYATDWLNMLGDLLYKRRAEAAPIFYELERKAAELIDRLQEDYPEAAGVLSNESAQPNPVLRFAETLTLLQGRGNTQSQTIKLVDSVLLVDRPNGLSMKRSVTRRNVGQTGSKRRDVRTIVFTDSVLDYLVHLQVLGTGYKRDHRPLSFKQFIKNIHKRYGFCVDQAPSGITISNELLRRNRFVLERRLRDLGLLVGVNDAESMKRLMPRFQPSEDNDNDLD
ncbi:MAG: hypothetical protein O2960_22320 [Verrucomicrobia bacterium]|nr:hypothetical protein [Verrucomicrobiota bacterium]